MIPVRLWLAGAGVAALLAGAGGLYLKGQHDAAAKLKPKIQAAETQAKVEQATTQALDHYTHDVTIIRERADHAVQTVQAAAGADTPLPSAVRAAWLDGLRRPDAEAPDDHHPGKPSR